MSPAWSSLVKELSSFYLRPGGLVAALLPQGVLRRGGPLAGDVAGPAPGAADPGADESDRGGLRHAVPRGDRAASLHVRAMYLNDQWDDLLEFRVEQEQGRLY